MAKNKQKKQRTTLQKFRFWRNWQLGLLGAKFAMPFIPFGIILGIHWNEWVGDSPSAGWSLGIGFGMLIVATASSIIGIWKKDEIAKSKISGVLYVALVFLTIGFALKLLASMINEMGDMLLYVSIGIAGSATVDEVDKLAINPNVVFYQDLVNTNGLSKSAAKKMDDTEQARKEGEEARKERIDLL